MKINMTPKEDPLNEAQITDNTPVDTVETPTEETTEWNEAINVWGAPEGVNEISSVTSEAKINVCISDYDTKALAALWEVEPNTHIKSTLLDVLNAYKEVNGQLEMAMRLYK